MSASICVAMERMLLSLQLEGWACISSCNSTIASYYGVLELVFKLLRVYLHLACIQIFINEVLCLYINKTIQHLF